LISVLYHLNDCHTNRQIVFIFYFEYLITTSLKKIKVFPGVCLCNLSRLIRYGRKVCIIWKNTVRVRILLKTTILRNVSNKSLQYNMDDYRCCRVMVVWKLDIQAYAWMSITTEVVSWNSAHGVVYSIQLYVVGFSSSTPVCSRNNIYHHDIVDILLRVVLNHINITLYRTDTIFVHVVYNTAE